MIGSNCQFFLSVETSRMLTAVRMLLLCGILWAATTPAYGEILIFTDRAAWEAAVGGNVIVEDFNSQTIRNFPSAFNESGFNGFTLTGDTNGDIVGIRLGSGDGNIDGTPFLVWRNQTSSGGDEGPIVTLNFTNPTYAFAFDWVDRDTTDEYELFIGDNYYFNPPFSKTSARGFFGIINTDGTFTSATFRNATGQSPGGYIDPFGIDNVLMGVLASPEATVTPEPASLAIWGLASLGLAYGARRARKQRQAT
jgi:hypothetical protein